VGSPSALPAAASLPAATPAAATRAAGERQIRIKGYSGECRC
jgi:hypothetical protein